MLRATIPAMHSAPGEFLWQFPNYAYASLFVSQADQLQPQPPIPQQGPAAIPSPLDAASAEPFFAGGLKTES